MNRRDFLTSATVTAASFALFSKSRLFAQKPSVTAPAAAQDAFVPLRRDVGVFNGRGGTIGWLASTDALAIIDTQFPDTAAKCLAGLPHRGEGKSGRQLDVVINTHHHGDHTSGNPIFGPVAKTIVAHANAPALQRVAATRAKPPTLDKQVYADTTFAETWKLALPGREGRPGETLHARHFGPAHTGGDIIVLFEKANVVHMGDLVFNRLYPVIDRIGGANITNWIQVLESAAKNYPDDAIYIFGHGNPKFGVTGARTDLLVMRDYLAGLLEYTRRQIAEGKTRAEITTLENLPGFDAYHQPLPNRLASNLGVAFDELTHAPSAT